METHTVAWHGASLLPRCALWLVSISCAMKAHTGDLQWHNSRRGHQSIHQYRFKEQVMTDSSNVSFRSHTQSVDRGVSIVIDTKMPMLLDGLLTFRLKQDMSPNAVGDLVALLRDHVDKIEFHHISKPIFERV
jgi:hypothetical protein